MSRRETPDTVAESPDASPEAVATRELLKWRPLLFAERKLIRNGDQVRAARELQRQSTRQVWLGHFIGAFWCVQGIDTFIERGRAAALEPLGWLLVVMGVLFAAEGWNSMVRARELRRFVEALLPAQALGVRRHATLVGSPGR